jgi:anti-anti-sigma factor
MNYQLDSNTKILTITFPGDILSTTANVLREEVFHLLDSSSCKDADWNTLKLDLAAARMIDSVGLNLLVAIIRAVKPKNKLVQAVISNANIQRTFIFTRLDRQLEIIKN